MWYLKYVLHCINLWWIIYLFIYFFVNAMCTILLGFFLGRFYLFSGRIDLFLGTDLTYFGPVWLIFWDRFDLYGADLTYFGTFFLLISWPIWHEECLTWDQFASFVYQHKLILISLIKVFSPWAVYTQLAVDLDFVHFQNTNLSLNFKSVWTLYFNSLESFFITIDTVPQYRK
jgi:hypothetical protein